MYTTAVEGNSGLILLGGWTALGGGGYSEIQQSLNRYELFTLTEHTLNMYRKE
jgi:hypothetical protein